LSPGQFTEEYAAKADQKRKRKQARSQLPSTKRRRLILKQERAVNQGASEALEGQSYQSGIYYFSCNMFSENNCLIIYAVGLFLLQFLCE
jgi:hypothetical protein